MPFVPKAEPRSRGRAMRKSEANNRLEVKMDANRLIAEVQKRPALWNQRHMSYHNREVTNRVWMEIAGIFKLPKPILKAKWKGLRDTFRAELKKEQVYRKSKYVRNRPIWIHFKSLHFLRDQMLPRPPVWERSSHSSNRSDDDCDGYQQIHQNGINSDGDDPQGDDSLAEHLLRSSIARSGENGQGSDIKEELEERFDDFDYHNVLPMDRSSENDMMMQNLSPEMLLNPSARNGPPAGDNNSSGSMSMDPLDGQHCDDNYYFLVSLLPHMRKLSAERRMVLRMKMQELVYEEVYKQKSSSTHEKSTTS